MVRADVEGLYEERVEIREGNRCLVVAGDAKDYGMIIKAAWCDEYDRVVRERTRALPYFEYHVFAK